VTGFEKKFASWAIVVFCVSLFNYSSSQKREKTLRIYFDKNVLGFILGDFFRKITWSP
jgi:hypothetical protein